MLGPATEEERLNEMLNDRPGGLRFYFFPDSRAAVTIAELGVPEQE